jgi:hypothetical protein
MKNQTNKTNQKGKAIASLVIGIIGVIFLFLWIDSRFLETGIGKTIYRAFFSIFDLNTTVILLDFSFIWVFFLSIFGVVLGIKSLISSKKSLAILGLILCGLDLIFSLFCSYWAVFLLLFSH